MQNHHLKLFFSPGSCSLAPHIVMRETGLEFDALRVSIPDGEHRGAEYLSVNPRGRLPALSIDTEILTENPAILSWLGGRAGMLPAEGSLAAARCAEWMAWLSSTVHIAFAQLWRPERFAPPAAFDVVQEYGRTAIEVVFEEIETRLSATYAIGEFYSVVDPYLLVFYRWGYRIGMEMAGRFPQWTRHTDVLLARRAVQIAIEVEGISIRQ